MFWTDTITVVGSLSVLLLFTLALPFSVNNVVDGWITPTAFTLEYGKNSISKRKCLGCDRAAITVVLPSFKNRAGAINGHSICHTSFWRASWQRRNGGCHGIRGSEGARGGAGVASYAEAPSSSTSSSSSSTVSGLNGISLDLTTLNNNNSTDMTAYNGGVDKEEGKRASAGAAVINGAGDRDGSGGMLRGQVNLYKNRCVLLQSKVMELQADLQTKQAMVEQLEEKLQQTINMAQVASDSALKERKEARQLQSELTSLEQSSKQLVDEVSDECTRLRNALERTNVELEDAGKYTDELKRKYQQQLARMEVSLADLEIEISRVEKEYSRARREWSDVEVYLNEELRKYRNRTVLLQEEVLRGRRMVTDAHRQLATLENAYVSLEADAGNLRAETAWLREREKAHPRVPVTNSDNGGESRDKGSLKTSPDSKVDVLSATVVAADVRDSIDSVYDAVESTSRQEAILKSTSKLAPTSTSTSSVSARERAGSKRDVNDREESMGLDAEVAAVAEVARKDLREKHEMEMRALRNAYEKEVEEVSQLREKQRRREREERQRMTEEWEEDVNKLKTILHQQETAYKQEMSERDDVIDRLRNDMDLLLKTEALPLRSPPARPPPSSSPSSSSPPSSYRIGRPLNGYSRKSAATTATTRVTSFTTINGSSSGGVENRSNGSGVSLSGLLGRLYKPVKGLLSSSSQAFGSLSRASQQPQQKKKRRGAAPGNRRQDPCLTSTTTLLVSPAAITVSDEALSRLGLWF